MSRRSSHGVRAAFVWGLAIGLLGALGTVICLDMGWLRGPVRTGTPMAAAETQAGQRIHVSGPLPAAVRVFVDGQAVASQTDADGLTLDLTGNPQRLELRGPDGPMWSTRLSGASGDTVTPVLDGEVMVELGRQARGGALYLDGVLVGEAPGTLARVTPGWHLISVRDGDRVLFEDACIVRSGQVTLVTVPPVPPRGKGRAMVRARVLTPAGFYEDEGATVYVDGEASGETPLELTLSAGFHSIRVESPGRTPYISVVAVDAGATRFVNAEFGQDERLEVTARPPHTASAQAPVAVPVAVAWEGGSVELAEGTLHLVRDGLANTVAVPLVPSGTDAGLWVAVIPAGIAEKGKPLSGYAACRDRAGREGTSDIFSLSVQ